MFHLLEVMVLRMYMIVFKRLIAVLPFRWPQTFEGTDSSLELVEYMASQNHQNILIVTDSVLVKLGILDKIIEALKSNRIQYHVYDAVEPNPTIAQIDQGYEMCAKHGCEAILAVGGGSPIDAAKMIGARAKNKKPILKMTGLFRVWHGMLPLYAVPTTAGTGSECTIAAVVTDPVRKRKLPAMDLRLMPTAAALDGALMTGLPPHITAATGMDALTHAVESYVSRNSMPETDEKAIEATQLIMKYLERAVSDGSDIQARQSMARASHLAGIAFTQVGVGYVHAIAHQFGAMYHTPHGLANAIVMPWVLDFSMQACAHRLAGLARSCHIGPQGGSDQELAQAFIAHIRAMNQKFGIASHLDALQRSDISEIARSALSEARFTYAVPRYMNMKNAQELIAKMLPV